MTWRQVISLGGSGMYCVPDTSYVDLREFTGGVRATVFGRRVLHPYGTLTAGVARTHESALAQIQTIASLALDSGGEPAVKPAIGIGGGMELRLSKSLALNLDFRAIKALGMAWSLQPSIGIGVRLH